MAQGRERDLLEDSAWLMNATTSFTKPMALLQAINFSYFHWLTLSCLCDAIA